MGTKFSTESEWKVGWLPQKGICDPVKCAAIMGVVDTGGVAEIISERKVPCQCML